MYRQWIWCVIEVVKTVFSGQSMGAGRSWYLLVSLTQTKPMPRGIRAFHLSMVALVKKSELLSGQYDRSFWKVVIFWETDTC